MNRQTDQGTDRSEITSRYEAPEIRDIGKATEVFLGWGGASKDSGKVASRNCN